MKPASKHTTTQLSMVLLGLAVGCGDGQAGVDREAADSGEAEPLGAAVILVEHAAWDDSSVAGDPLARHRPDPVDCDIAGWLVEADELELDTGRCNYVALEQPALAEVEPGDQVALELRHFDLTSPEPALAHAALLFGDVVVWELEIPIPHDAQVLKPEWTAEHSIGVGESVGFHLHNHGQNTWNLAAVSVRHQTGR